MMIFLSKSGLWYCLNYCGKLWGFLEENRREGRFKFSRTRNVNADNLNYKIDPELWEIK